MGRSSHPPSISAVSAASALIEPSTRKLSTRSTAGHITISTHTDPSYKRPSVCDCANVDGLLVQLEAALDRTPPPPTRRAPLPCRRTNPALVHPSSAAQAAVTAMEEMGW